MIKAGQLKEHIDALEGFERDYRRYIEAQAAEEEGREPDLSQADRTSLRRDLLRRVDAAERAMRQADKMLHVEPPRAVGGHALTALSDQVFAHETPLFGSGEPWLALPSGLLDTMVAALGALEDQRKVADDFAKDRQRADPARRRKAPKAEAEGTPWYHNQWVIVIGGGAIATVLGGIILGLVL